MISSRLLHASNKMCTIMKGHQSNGFISRHPSWKNANFSTSPIVAAIEGLAHCESMTNRMAAVSQIRDMLHGNIDENDSDDLEPIYLRLDDRLEYLQGKKY